MPDVTTKTCCVCEGIINHDVTCKRCKKPACYICTDPNSACIACCHEGRKGLNKGKFVGRSEIDPLPDAPCDFCKKQVPANELTYCVGECLQRFCIDCLVNDDVRCACPQEIEE